MAARALHVCTWEITLSLDFKLTEAQSRRAAADVATVGQSAALARRSWDAMRPPPPLLLVLLVLLAGGGGGVHADDESKQSVEVRLPPGVSPGQTLSFNAPDGSGPFTLTVPEGATAGQVLSVRVPKQAAPAAKAGDTPSGNIPSPGAAGEDAAPPAGTGDGQAKALAGAEALEKLMREQEAAQANPEPPHADRRDRSKYITSPLPWLACPGVRLTDWLWAQCVSTSMRLPGRKYSGKRRRWPRPRQW